LFALREHQAVNALSRQRIDIRDQLRPLGSDKDEPADGINLGTDPYATD
jgi:hypothetical protein